MRFPPSINPRTFTFVAFIIGYALIDDLTSNEQNSIGNWLMLVGQVLETNSGQQQVIEERINGNTININGKNFKQCGDPFMNNPPLYKKKGTVSVEDLNFIKSVIDKMQREIDKLINEN